MMNATKTELFLPDGTPTDLRAGDELVWQKLGRKFTFRRPGVGTLQTDPSVLENPYLTNDSATAEEVRSQFATGLCGTLPLDVELANDSSDEATFRFVNVRAQAS